MAVRQRGVPEVPLDAPSRDWLVELRQNVVDLRGTLAVPNAPSNFKATALAFAVLLQWTRGQNSDGTQVLWNSTPTLAGANIIDVGGSAQHVDYVGNTAITRFYWVRSYDSQAPTSSPSTSSAVGPLSATTLASGVGVTPPAPPPGGGTMAIEPTTGHVVPTNFQRGGI
jgi:hypothetical protein